MGRPDQTNAAELQGALERVRMLCSDFSPGEILHRTGKSLVLAGTVQNEHVVAKVLLDESAFWREKFEQEIAAYRYFRHQLPPFNVPRLVEADEARAVLLIRHVPGRPLALQRYPEEPLPQTDLDIAFAAIESVDSWKAGPEAPFQRVFDYPVRLERYRDYGPLDERDHSLLSSVVSRQDESWWTFCHGDPLLSNFLRSGNESVLVDWEFSGFFLQGFDLAILWVLLHSTPAARERIRDIVRRTGEKGETVFVVNLAMVLTREIRIHRELPPAPAREALLATLWEDWTTVRREIRAAFGGA
jgi:Phosphotransferase enzyme family